MVFDQLESMTQCFILSAHTSFRAASMGISRDARLDREDRLLRHLGHLLTWIQNRAPPPGWETSDLVALATQCLDHPAPGKKGLGTQRKGAASRGAHVPKAPGRQLPPRAMSTGPWESEGDRGYEEGPDDLDRDPAWNSEGEGAATEMPQSARILERGGEERSFPSMGVPKRRALAGSQALAKRGAKASSPVTEATGGVAGTDGASVGEVREVNSARMRELVLGVFGNSKPNGATRSLAPGGRPPSRVGDTAPPSSGTGHPKRSPTPISQDHKRSNARSPTLASLGGDSEVSQYAPPTPAGDVALPPLGGVGGGGK